MGHLAVDLGASKGKVFYGDVEGSGLGVEEVHRFDNWPTKEGGRYYWDVERLCDEIIEGMKKAESKFDELDSIGIDTWGVDFGLVKGEELIKKPYSYRDPKLTSTLNELLEEVSKKEVFMATGISHWNVPNTLWQCHYLRNREPKLLESADKLVMMPQLLSWMLGSKIFGEVTDASTSQFLDPTSRDWAQDFLKKLDLPTEKLPELKNPGTKIGELEKSIAMEVESRPDIVLPASHDTASAVAGIPLEGGNRAFLSAGSWLIVGIELDEPVLTEEAFEIEASNELGVGGTTRFLKNVTGFFLLEECRREWKEEGKQCGYSEIVEKASSAEPFASLIDPDDDSFTIEGKITEKIADYCRETDQKVPDSIGKFARCIFESLALKTSITLEDLMEVADESADKLHLGGGAVRNEYFCQMLSSAVQMPVHAGPVEAAAVGNILTQAKAYSEIGGIEEGRQLVRESLKIRKYEPEEREQWTEAKSRLKELIRGR